MMILFMKYDFRSIIIKNNLFFNNTNKILIHTIHKISTLYFAIFL